MSIFKKILTAIRGNISEAGEAFVEDQQINIFKQEIRDAEDAMKDAKEALAGVMADEAVHRQKVERITEQRDALNDQAVQAVEAGEDGLAEEILERVETVEIELESVETVYNELKTSVATLEADITERTRQIRNLKSKISQLEAQDKLNKATKTLQDKVGTSTSQLSGMTDSLTQVQDNIAKKAAQNAARQKMADKESGADLEARMKAAGIGAKKGSSAKERLAALKAEKASK